ncbi:MAG: DNA alkylation repair protein [Alphaproteobacteria bacterium]|nr:DNA alkylation repair protein [Alphaproteobacteria bacterium]
MLKEIRNKLSKLANPEIAKSNARFFKEPVKFYGMKSADVGKVAREFFPAIDKMEKSDVFDLAEKLMQSDIQEEFGIATEFVYRVRKQFDRTDFKIFDKWVKNYINNWAKCDTFCNHSVADLVEKFPELIPDVKKWSSSKNRWVRRAAAVTFILPARHGKFIDDVFEIADAMITDSDDMVQKGYGWALKAASETNPKIVYDFVVARFAKMPRTAYRYAIEKLPADMRKKAMSL